MTVTDIIVIISGIVTIWMIWKIGNEEDKMSDNNQTYKADNGKTRLDLVSPTFIEAVGKIRTFGVQKYGDSDSWTKVEPQLENQQRQYTAKRNQMLFELYFVLRVRGHQNKRNGERLL